MSYAEWAFFDAFVVEKGPRRGRRPRDHRLVLSGVFLIARTARPAVICTAISANGTWSIASSGARTQAGISDVLLEAMNETIEGHGNIQMIDSTSFAPISAPPARQKKRSEPGSWPLARWLLD